MAIDRVPTRPKPYLFDKVIAKVQAQIADNIHWLDHVFGKSERITKVINGRRYYIPTVYIGDGEYMDISPDSNIGNYCFFSLRDGQEVSWLTGTVGDITATFDLVMWFNTTEIYEGGRDIEFIKAEILSVLSRTANLNINSISELSENVFRGYSFDEVDAQFMVAPYAGLRFTGELKTTELCL